MNVIKLAIVGTGGMAHTHAKAFSAIRACKLVAACDVIPERAEAFVDKHGIPEVYADVDEMLAQSKMDAVSVVTPDAAHAAISLKAIAQGKHVLCEKPLATCYGDAKEMADAAQRAGVINMVNLSYRNASAIQKAHQLVQQGALGRIMHVEASYLQSWLSAKHWGDWRSSPAWLWRLSTQHGSRGVLGDIGVHILDFATFAAGDIQSVNCRLKTFPKAQDDRVDDYVLDANDSAVITVELTNGAIGTIHTTRWATGHSNSLRLRVYGDKGALVVDLDQAWDTLQICRGRAVDKVEWKTLRCGQTPNIYQRFIKSIRTGCNDQPDFARGAAVQKMLDACFESDQTGKTLAV
jgi:predicted dehydrogenase